jgi:hypothetical protein
MTEDGKPLETLLEDAARARRLAVVLRPRSSLSDTPKKWRPRSTVVRRRIGVNNLLAVADAEHVINTRDSKKAGDGVPGLYRASCGLARDRA